MHRLTNHQHIKVVNAALNLLPNSIRSLVEHVDILSDIDPNFVGLHQFKNASYGRQYKDTPHVSFKFHTSDKSTTMFLPDKIINIKTVIHELGHVLDENLNFEFTTKPVTRYGETNRWESFAESFTAWVLPDEPGYLKARDKLYETDKRTVNLFERLK